MKALVDVKGNLLETKADSKEVGHVNEENEWLKRLEELKESTGGSKIKRARPPAKGKRKRTSPAQRLATRRF